MRIFITGTDTDVGKTVISSWLCVHSGYDYIKPIQTGRERDQSTVKALSQAVIHPECYLLKTPVSPHHAASLENVRIETENIPLPDVPNLIVEGAGGVLVPLNENTLMIDLIKYLGTPVILVARTTLGTINHTLLSLEALKSRGIPVLGVILNGLDHPASREAISFYGQVDILATVFPFKALSYEALKQVPLTPSLKEILEPV